MNKKRVWHKFISSILTLALFLSMFIGTTYAWFTDSAGSSDNIIRAGNLDIEMYWSDTLLEADSADWNNVENNGNEAIFNYDKWESGYTEVKYIKIVNEGNLALKYMLNIVPSGDAGILADVIDVYYVENPTSVLTRQMINDVVSVGVLSEVFSKNICDNGILLPANAKERSYTCGEVIVAIALKMQETAGNEYQTLGSSCNFDVQLFATQYTYEEDVFNNNYDTDATYYVTDTKTLATALANGEDVTLGADIVLTADDVTWDYNGATNKAAHLYIPENAELTLDLNGYTLTNTHVSPTVRHDVIANYGTLTLTDSEGSGKLISDNNSENVQVSGGFAVCSYGDLNLQNVTIDGNTGSYTIYVDGVGNTLTVDNATVSGRGALAVYNGAHGIVNSGEFSIDVLTSNARDNVLCLYNATADVYGGSFDGTRKTLGSNDDYNWKASSCVMLMDTSTANIYGGTYVASEADLFSHGTKSAIYVYDGSFNTVNALGNSPLHEHNKTALVEVYGGTFIYDPSDYLGEGYKVVQNNNKFTVVSETTTE